MAYAVNRVTSDPPDLRALRERIALCPDPLDPLDLLDLRAWLEPRALFQVRLEAKDHLD